MIATDDTWLTDKIARQVAIMESMLEKIGILYSDAYQMDENGLHLPDMFIASHRKFNSVPEGDLRERLIYSNFIPAMTTLIRRTVYERVGLYDESLAYEDWDFWLRAANHFHFAYSPYPSANYRILDSSLIRSLLARKNAAFYHTHFQIHKKILAMPGISQSSRTLTVKRLSKNAHKLYVMGHPKAPRALVSSFIATKQFSDLYWALLGFIGISHKQYLRTESYLRWRFSCLSIRNSSNKEKGK
jgi:hypothetical protein